MKNKLKGLIIVTVTLLCLFTNLDYSLAHDPKYVDLKYYEDDEILSVYITHGVSDYDVHYVESVIIVFYELLNETFKIDYNDEEAHMVEGDVLAYGNPNQTAQYVFSYTSQETHQVFHNNYSLPADEWTFIEVTAVCNQGGNFTNTMVVGHYPYYDVEHSMIEALVPTIVCSIVTMIPIGFVWILRRKKGEYSNF